MGDDVTNRRMRDPEYFLPLEIRGVPVPGGNVRWRVEVDLEELTLPKEADFTDEYFCTVMQTIIDEIRATGFETVTGW